MTRTIDTDTKHVHAEVDDDGVLVITLDRPERRNAMLPEMWSGLAAALADGERADDVGCVVLTGAGGAFCAGGDVKRMADGSSAPPPERSFEEVVAHQQDNTRATSATMFTMATPTLAVLPGPAAGAGLGLALSCDMRLAVDTAIMTTAFTKVGLSGDYGINWFLTRLVGPAKAKELMFLSDKLDMHQALDLGLVNWSVPAGDFEATWRDLARRLAAGPRVAYAAVKDNVNRAIDGELADCLDAEVVNHRRSAATDDHVEGRTAFAERRPPTFTGR